MTGIEDGARKPGNTARAGIRRVEFDQDLRFQQALHQRVDGYFRGPGRRRRDCWQMHARSVSDNERVVIA